MAASNGGHSRSCQWKGPAQALWGLALQRPLPDGSHVHGPPSHRGLQSRPLMGPQAGCSPPSPPSGSHSPPSPTCSHTPSQGGLGVALLPGSHGTWEPQTLQSNDHCIIHCHYRG